MKDSVIEATIEAVFHRVPREIPIAEMLLPLQFLCAVYNEREVCDWFNRDIGAVAIETVLRFETLRIFLSDCSKAWSCVWVQMLVARRDSLRREGTEPFVSCWNFI
jgi:hypothetical protein